MLFDRYQHNRNPFVDRPEWVLLAFSPQLAIGREALSMRMNWPAEYSDAVLESAPFLTGSWTAVTNAPTMRSNRFSVLLPSRTQPQFFRLRLQ